VEGVEAAAQEFLADANAIESALQVDRRRAVSLSIMRSAFEEFRAGQASLADLAAALKQPLWEVAEASRGGTPRNLWGFENDDERAFTERLAAAASRVRNMDLDSVVRSYLREDPTSDEERVQQLLAFGEFAASLDALGTEDDARLGVGPAANFLTFAWHCRSGGEQPVFLYNSTRAIQSIAESGGLGPGATVAGRDLEHRFRTFYRVARALERALASAPRAMRSGWAVEHALTHIQGRIDGVTNYAGKGGAGSSGMWRPRERADLRREFESGSHPVIVPAKGGATIQPPRARDVLSEEEISDEVKALLEVDDPSTLTPASAKKRNRFLDIARRTVVHADTRLFETSGANLSDVLPPDRSSTDTPFFAVASPRAAEVRRENEARAKAKRKADTRRIKREFAEKARREAEAESEERRANETSHATPTLDPPSRPAVPTLDSPRVSAPTLEIPEIKPSPEPKERAPQRSTPLPTEVLLADALVDDVLAALNERGRVLLVGPASTGKTFVARRIATQIAGSSERALHLRGHPELAYSELVDAPDGTAGVLRAFCERAQAASDLSFVIVLDEIDRGDAARALGELLGAFSERGEEVMLPRSRRRFQIPTNVCLLATARELPHDPALIGRFPVVKLDANSEILRRHLMNQGRPDLGWVADMLKKLNQELAKRGHPLRVGHGLFMVPDLDGRRVQGIWRREVVPLIESHGIESGDLGYPSLRP
jgi:hypothetical protein